ncbi:hypothetical protein BH24CHL7_BH24CHL7_04290 [soil metagenome]
MRRSPRSSEPKASGPSATIATRATSAIEHSPEYAAKRALLTADERLELDLVEQSILITPIERYRRTLADGTIVDYSGLDKSGIVVTLTEDGRLLLDFVLIGP